MTLRYARRDHKAFAGTIELDDVRRARIEYFDAARAATMFGCSPLQKTKRSYGWYWAPMRALYAPDGAALDVPRPDTWRGPFTSSRRALWNAQARMAPERA